MEFVIPICSLNTTKIFCSIRQLCFYQHNQVEIILHQYGNGNCTDVWQEQMFFSRTKLKGIKKTAFEWKNINIMFNGTPGV